jgi:hypothetical protein
MRATLAFMDAFSNPNVIQWKLCLALAGMMFYIAGPAVYIALRFDPMGAHPEALATGATIFAIGLALIGIVVIF